MGCIAARVSINSSASKNKSSAHYTKKLCQSKSVKNYPEISEQFERESFPEHGRAEIGVEDGGWADPSLLGRRESYFLCGRNKWNTVSKVTFERMEWNNGRVREDNSRP